MSPWALNRLVHALSRGAVIGYPTDTIWGLGCHPLRTGSVARILRIKNRSPGKGLILLASRLEYCAVYLAAEDRFLKAIQHPAERPTTWLVPASEFCPFWLSGDHATVAIRITDHPLVSLLCDRLESPLISTSANRGGRPPVRNALQLRRQFGDELDFIVSGYATGSGRPSDIKSLLQGTSLRSSNR